MMPSARSGFFPVPLVLLLAATLPAPLRASGGPSLSGLSEIGAPPPFVRFAAVGAVDARAEAGRRVCDRVRSWTPGFVIALGAGGFPGESVESHGFPSREGRSEFRRGPVHVFFLADDDGAGREGGAGGTSGSDAEWLRKALSASTAPWKVVCLPRAPYSSYPGSGADKPARWPFRQWGADAVIAGRDGHYERLEVDGIPYFVNGLEGKAAPERLPGSQCVFDEDLGAMLVEADAVRMDFRFVTSEGLVVDALSLRHGGVASGQGRQGRGTAALPASLSR